MRRGGGSLPESPLAQRALHPGKPLAQHMGIDLRGSHIRMPQQRLHGANVAATPEQLGGEGVPEGMTAGGLVHARAPQRLLDRFLDGADMNVMTHDLAILVRAQAGGRKQPLPFERARRVRVLAAQGKRQADRRLIERLPALPGIEDTLLALEQTADQRGGQQGCAVFATFAVMDGDHLPVEVEIFHPQPGRLDHPEPGAVHQRSQQLIGLREQGKNFAGLGMGQHRGDMSGALGPHNFANLSQRLLQHPRIQEHQRIERQILRGRRHLALNRQPTEKGIDLHRPHLQRVAQLMEADKVTNPVPVGFLGANTVVVQPHHHPHLLAQTGFGG